MKFFITGGVGMLGSNIAKKLLNKNHKVSISYSTNSPFFKVNSYKIDVSTAKIKEIIEKEAPDWVIHTAAITDVDYCEKEKDVARNVNVVGTRQVTDACETVGANLVYISTTHVFDGSKKNYSEDDIPKAKNYYSQTKLEGEIIVKDSKLKNWVIVRPDQIYCWHPFKTNFVKSTLDKLNTCKPFNVFDDWYNQPTFAEDLSEIIIHLVEKKKKGIFNAAGSTYLNRFEWAKLIAEVFQKDKKLVLPSKSTSINLPAKRPNVCVDLSKIEKVIGRKTIGVREGMKLMKKEKEGDFY